MGSVSGCTEDESRAGGEKPARLRRSADVRRAIREGTRVPERWMVLHVLPREGRCRAGFVAGRRVGGAVVRNQARRRMREAWRQLGPTTGTGCDVVFVARPEIVRAKTQDLIAESRRGLVRAGVMTA